MEKLIQEFKVPFRYEVWFTRQLFRRDNPLLADLLTSLSQHLPARVLVVIDQGLANHHPQLGARLAAYAQAFGGQLQLCGQPVMVPGGEDAKNNPELVEQLLREINERGIDRHAYVMAIGGGAVLDLVGYAAAIAHRGIRHIRIPTTVLSQNDSGIGVKNGINYFGKKNFLGCFAPPVAVVNDFDFLHTLDDRDWRSGMSEAVKVSLIKDAGFFEFLEAQALSLARREDPPMERLIIDCARLHLQHIAGGDPFEQGSARPLDFGHWAAHKLEQLSQYQLRHGEAVAIGIALDTTYSYLAGLIQESDWQRVVRLLRELGFDLYTPELGREEDERLALLDGLQEFREHLGGQLTITLLEAIGKGREVHEMDTQLIRRAIGQLERLGQAAEAR